MKTKQPDWEAIERAYRAGMLSLRAMAEQFGSKESTIRSRASKNGWKMDLTAQVKAATKEKLSRSTSRTTVAQSDVREDGSRRTSRYDIDLTKCIFCGFCEESCPVDSIVETHIFEYHGEKRGDLYFTKEMLLAVGDRYESEIAANRAADAKYR